MPRVNQIIEKIQPLSLSHHKDSLALRRKGVLRLRDQNKTVNVNLFNKKRGILQGVYSVLRFRRKRERIFFYVNKTSTNSSLNVYNSKGKIIARFSRTLGHREVLPRYRNAGVGRAAFDLLEDEVYSRGNSNLLTSTEKSDTAAFLLKRGYKEYDEESQRVLADYVIETLRRHDSLDNSKLPSEVSLIKELSGTKRQAFDLSKMHRIKVVGKNGEVKYWYGQIFIPVK